MRRRYVKKVIQTVEKPPRPACRECVNFTPNTHHIDWKQQPVFGYCPHRDNRMHTCFGDDKFDCDFFEQPNT